MNYPNDFDIPTFPAGKAVALSRSVSIWTAIVFFLIVVSCGLMLLLNNSRRNYPFLISTDLITFDWTVAAYPQKNVKINPYRNFQETLIKDYVKYWFSINKDNDVNEAIWQKCSADECKSMEQYNPTNYKCALFCMSAPELFQQFSDKVLPEYRDRIELGSEVIFVNKPALIISPTDENDSTGIWQYYGSVVSSKNGIFDILAFIEVGFDSAKHPATLGYYIKDFNSYRLVVEQVNE